MLAHLGIDLVGNEARPAHRLRLAAGTRAAVAPLPFTGVVGFAQAARRGAAACRRRRWRDRHARRGGNCARSSGDTRVGQDRAPGHRSDVGCRCHRQAQYARHDALADRGNRLQDGFRADRRCRSKPRSYRPAFKPRRRLCRLMPARRRLGLGVLAGIARLPAHGSVMEWRKQLDWMSRRSPHFGDLIAGAVPLMRRPLAVSAIPFGYRRRQAVAPNVYAVGDQLAVIHSFTGDGTAIALMSGVAAAHAVASGESAEAYQHAVPETDRAAIALGEGRRCRLRDAAGALAGYPQRRPCPSDRDADRQPDAARQSRLRAVGRQSSSTMKQAEKPRSDIRPLVDGGRAAKCIVGDGRPIVKRCRLATRVLHCCRGWNDPMDAEAHSTHWARKNE